MCIDELVTSFRDVDAIIFVLDSSDKLRMPIAKDELDQLLHHQGIYIEPIILPSRCRAHVYHCPYHMQQCCISSAVYSGGMMSSRHRLFFKLGAKVTADNVISTIPRACKQSVYPILVTGCGSACSKKFISGLTP